MSDLEQDTNYQTKPTPDVPMPKEAESSVTVASYLQTIAQPKDVPVVPIARSVDGTVVQVVPMSMIRQAAQRGMRTMLQALTVMLGGGTLADALSRGGFPTMTIAGIPSTGNPFYDAVLMSLVLGVVTFIWNLVELWASVDQTAPKWRA